MSGDLDKHIKMYLGISAVVASIYGAWQVFEGYNTDTVELGAFKAEVAQKEKESVETNKEIVAAVIATRRDTAAKILEMNARARAHYEEMRKKGELREAEERRLDYLEEAVPKQEAEVEKLTEKLDELEK